MLRRCRSFFWALTRIVAKGGGVVSGWKIAVDYNDPTMGSTTPVGVQSVASGSSLTVTAQPMSGYYFGYWQFDGVNYPTWANPVTIPAQADGSVHDLIAVFQGKGIAMGRTIYQRLSALFSNSWTVGMQQTLASLFRNSWDVSMQQTVGIKFKAPLIKDDLTAVGSWVLENATGEVLAAVASSPTPYQGLADCLKVTFTSVAANQLIGIKQTFGTPQDWSNMIDIHFVTYLSTITNINNGVILKITDNTGKAVYDWCATGNGFQQVCGLASTYTLTLTMERVILGDQLWDVETGNFHAVPVGFDWTHISSVEMYVSYSATASGYIAFNQILSWSN